jgi:hypothetical protein
MDEDDHLAGMPEVAPQAQLVSLIEQAGLNPVAELRLPPEEYIGPGLVVMARRPG